MLFQSLHKWKTNLQFQIINIFKKELSGHFNNPFGAIIICALASISIFLCLEIGQFIEFDDASFYSFFQFTPWVFGIFIPAISMKIWTEENKQGTFELLKSLPIKAYKLVLGKLFAALFIVIIALALSFPFWVIINFLGHPDNFVILGGYIASIILAATYLSLCMAISANIKTPSIAFILGAGICFILNSTGLPIIASFITKFFRFLSLESFSTISIFDAMIRGNYNVSGLLFYFSLIAFGIYLNISKIKKPSFKTNRQEQFLKKYNSYIAFLALIFFNFLCFSFFNNNKIDLTQSRDFTISKPIKEIINNVKSNIIIDFYYSQNAATQNPLLRNHAQKIIDKLNQIKSSSKGKVVLNIKHIEQFLPQENDAIANGLIPFKDEMAILEPIYLGLVIKHNGKEFVFKRLSPQDFPQFEFSLNKAFSALQKNRREKIAIITAQNWFFDNDLSGQIIPNSQISKNLMNDYDISLLSPNFTKLPENIDLLFIAQPWDLSKDEQYAIDQYFLKGGNAIISLDAFSSISNDNKIGKTYYTQSLGSLETSLGLAFSNQITLDKNNALQVNAEYNGRETILSQPLFFNLKNKDFKNGVNFGSASNFEIGQNSNLKFTPIFTTSNDIMSIEPQEIFKNSDAQNFLENWQSLEKTNIIAGQITGIYKSAFNGAIGTRPVNIMAIADSDFLFDSLYINSDISIADNAGFITAAIENLLGNKNISQIILPNQKQRNLEYIENLKLNAQNKIIDQETFLNQKLNELNQEIALNKDENSQEVKNLKSQISKTKAELNQTKNGIRLAIERVKSFIILVCAIIIPMIFMLFALFNFYRRTQGVGRGQNS